MSDGPRLNRSITLQFKGDWGQANLHRVCGWLCQEIGDGAGPHSRIAIWNGRGGVDNVRAVGRGEVDVSLATPAAFVKMAVDGKGPYGGEAFPHLRALGTVAQTDRLVLAVSAEHGIRSFADLRERRPVLRIATSPDDGINHIGLAVHRIMELSGIPDHDLEAWRGRFVEDERPFPCLQAVADGAADAVFYEAIMTARWQQLANERQLTFVPIEDGVLDQLERDFGWPRAVLPAGYFRGLEEPLPTLDFSDFLVLARMDMPDDVAYLIAWCLVETRAKLEAQYRHIPPERSPVTYPLEPAKIAATAIPLHPGAASYYASAGLLTA
ncbi:MAG TPA: TAXI family TRAP transporter solute-binding subunit [Chloroflexota bacterium]|nr:TAXI family TRAP transporter solute-binding subunit [Chloroflexota bacterium]